MNYLIWSEEHLAWWGPNEQGYTRSILAAGRYPLNKAEQIIQRANRFIDPAFGISFLEIAIPDPLEVT